MKHALIDPQFSVATGYRVAEVLQSPFEVASPLFWQECPDEVVADQFYFDPSDNQFLLTPPPPPPTEADQPVVEGAQTL
jgi:hypothetical protein